MSTRVVAVVERRQLFREGLVCALREVGHDARGFSDPASLTDDPARPDAVVVDVQQAGGSAADELIDAVIGASGDALIVVIHQGRGGRSFRSETRIRLVSVDGGVAALSAALNEHQLVGKLAWQPPSIGFVPLSDRESSILHAVAVGSTSREIGELLGISTRTVENHKRRIFLKLGAHNQAQAVAVAARAGLLPPTAAMA